MKVCIIGSGKWGTAISNLLKQNAVSVTLISRNDYTILKTEKFDIAYFTVVKKYANLKCEFELFNII